MPLNPFEIFLQENEFHRQTLGKLLNEISDYISHLLEGKKISNEKKVSGLIRGKFDQILYKYAPVMDFIDYEKDRIMDLAAFSVKDFREIGC